MYEYWYKDHGLTLQCTQCTVCRTRKVETEIRETLTFASCGIDYRHGHSYFVDFAGSLGLLTPLWQIAPLNQHSLLLHQYTRGKQEEGHTPFTDISQIYLRTFRNLAATTSGLLYRRWYLHCCTSSYDDRETCSFTTVDSIAKDHLARTLRRQSTVYVRVARAERPLQTTRLSLPPCKRMMDTTYLTEGTCGTCPMNRRACGSTGRPLQHMSVPGFWCALPTLIQAI